MMMSTLLLAVTGFLIEARGGVSLHRHEARQDSPAGAGAEVHLGDTIRVSANGRARILCPDLLTTWQPAPQSSSGVFEGCSGTSERIRSRQSQQALGIRSVEQVPWVLMPSNTVLMTATPLLRWEPVSGVKRYRVSLLTTASPPRPVWGPALIEGTSIKYSAKAALVPGVEYVVRVEAEGGARAEGKPFVVGSADIRTKIHERTSYFEKTIPEQPSRNIATAIYLISEGVRADALTLLEPAADAEKSAALSLLQARCLAEVGDVGAQRESLERAASEAEQIHDLSTEAEALIELARVSSREEATRMSKRAASLLQRLGVQWPLREQ